MKEALCDARYNSDSSRWCLRLIYLGLCWNNILGRYFFYLMKIGFSEYEFKAVFMNISDQW